MQSFCNIQDYLVVVNSEKMSYLNEFYFSAKSAKMAMLEMKPYDFGFTYSKGFHFDLECGSLIFRLDKNCHVR